MKEALRYWQNAKEILKSAPVENGELSGTAQLAANNIYTDLKPVREAFSAAYLAVLEAINEHLVTNK